MERCLASRNRRGERLIEIGDDVFPVLDADAQADQLRRYAGLALLRLRHLPVGRRGRMTGERLGVAKVNQAADELERIVEARARRVSAAHTKSDERASLAGEVLLRQSVVGI